MRKHPQTYISLLTTLDFNGKLFPKMSANKSEMCYYTKMHQQQINHTHNITHAPDSDRSDRLGLGAGDGDSFLPAGRRVEPKKSIDHRNLIGCKSDLCFLGNKKS